MDGAENKGRRSKDTPENRERFLNGLRAGMTRAGAAGLIRVHKSRITRWCQKNATFATECDIAEQEAEARFATVVIKAATNDPKYALEWLKRRRPQEWGDAARIEVMRQWAEEAKATPEDDLLREMGYEPERC